jgi:mannonate dehydratase
MYLGTQIKPRDDSDYRVWAQLGVNHVCVDPPGNPHDWTVDALSRQREHVEKFGLTLDMVQLPLSSRPIEEAQSPNILLGKDPERQRELDSICRLIERIGVAGIPAVKYNFNIIGIPRTAHEAGRGGSRNAAFRWSAMDQSASPGLAGLVSEEENWARIESPYHGLNFCQGTVAEMLDEPEREIDDVIRWFGTRGKLFNVHFRNIRGRKLDFTEAFPDEGDMDMARSLRVYREIGYQYMLMPDHVPEIDGRDPSGTAFAFCYGYIRGLLDATAC